MFKEFMHSLDQYAVSRISSAVYFFMCGLEVLIPVHSVMCKKVMLLLDQYAVSRILSDQCAVYNKCMCGLVLWTIVLIPACAQCYVQKGYAFIRSVISMLFPAKWHCTTCMVCLMSYYRITYGIELCTTCISLVPRLSRL